MKLTERPLGRHSISAMVGAVLAVGSMSLIPALKPERVVEKRVEQRVERQVQTSGKWTWGELTPIEQARAVAALNMTLKGVKVEIFCGGAWCNDLAEDLDEVMDQAGADSSHQRPIVDLTDAGGKPIAAIGVWPDTAKGQAVAEALRSVTDGRISMTPLPAMPDQGDRVVIAIGRKPRH